MKTKQVPIIITLLAGFITCIIGIAMHMETGRFVKTWGIVLLSFYILGCIAKLVLDKNFKVEEETEGSEGEAAEEGEAEAGEEEAAGQEAEEESPVAMEE